MVLKMENKRRNRKKKVIKFDSKRLHKFLKNATDFTSNIENFQYTEMDSPTLMEKLDYVNDTFKKLEIERKKLYKLLDEKDFEVMNSTNNGFVNLKWIHKDTTRKISQASFKLSKHKKEEDFWNKELGDSWLNDAIKSEDDDSTTIDNRIKLEDDNKTEVQRTISDKEEAIPLSCKLKEEFCTQKPRVFVFEPLEKGCKVMGDLFIIPSIYAPDELQRKRRREEEKATRREQEEATKRDLRTIPESSKYLDVLRKTFGPERAGFNTNSFYSDSD
ncbi:hypothetical protein ACFFRR_004087 [Megaselia abdita]